MYLLDTNVVSELRKASSGKADPNVAAWAAGVAVRDLFVSAMSILELEIGVLRLERRDSQQGSMLREWMNRHVLPGFEGRILAVDSRVAQRCARLHVPDPRPDRDSLIAATALVHRFVVVTRNTSDFASLGVDLIDPWR